MTVLPVIGAIVCVEMKNNLQKNASREYENYAVRTMQRESI